MTENINKNLLRDQTAHTVKKFRKLWEHELVETFLKEVKKTDTYQEETQIHKRNQEKVRNQSELISNAKVQKEKSIEEEKTQEENIRNSNPEKIHEPHSQGYENNNVYYEWETIEWCDVSSLKDWWRKYVTDKDNVYYEWKKIKWCDVRSFEYHSNGYISDKNNIYYKWKILEWCDVKSFKRLWDPWYISDKNNVYYKWKIIEWCDVKSFKFRCKIKGTLYEDKYWYHQDENIREDKNGKNLYHAGKVLEHINEGVSM